jgi:hypothetical protein
MLMAFVETTDQERESDQTVVPRAMVVSLQRGDRKQSGRRIWDMCIADV